MRIITLVAEGCVARPATRAQAGAVGDDAVAQVWGYRRARCPARLTDWRRLETTGDDWRRLQTARKASSLYNVSSGEQRHLASG